MNIIDHPSPNWNHRPSWVTAPLAMVMHATAGHSSLGHLCDPAPNGVPEHAVSAHYLIAPNGDVYRLVANEHRAWHAGYGAIPGLPYDPNDISIGIEMENLNDGREPYAVEQYRSAVELVRGLVRQYQIPRQYVVRHADIALPPGRKTDPAPEAWNMETFLDTVYDEATGYHTLIILGNGLRVRQGPGVSFPQATRDGQSAVLNAGETILVDTIVAGDDVDGESHWAHLVNGLGFVTMKFCRFA